MNKHSASLIMTIITLFWGSSYLFMKQSLNSMDVFCIISLRFITAFVITFPILICIRKKITPTAVFHSLNFGLLLILVFVFILEGLRTTTSTSASFLVSLTVIFVPLLTMLSKQSKPKPAMFVTCSIALIGVAILTLSDSFGLSKGDIFCVLGSFFYALHILYGRHAVKDSDPLAVGIMQVGFAGFISLLFSLKLGSFHLPQTPAAWGDILALGILCSAFGFVLQPVTQKYISPVSTGLIFSLEPVFASVFSILIEHTFLPVHCYFGALLIFLSVIANGVFLKN